MENKDFEMLLNKKLTEEQKNTINLVIENLENIVDMHLQGEKLIMPPKSSIAFNEWNIYQQVTRLWRRQYSSRMEFKTTTHDELVERMKDFNKNINPFVIYYSKLIYSLIKYNIN